MNKLVMAIVFVVVTGGMWFVCDNSHIDFFPCEITRGENDPARPGAERIVTVEGTCSLMSVTGSKMPGDPRGEEFTPIGWALLVAFCGGIGLAAGVAAGMLARKRR
jgi:hypothetical protein